jgi:hypothetical protein
MNKSNIYIEVTKQVLGVFFVIYSSINIECASLTALYEYLLIVKKIRFRKTFLLNPGYVVYIISDLTSKILSVLFFGFFIHGS